MRFQPVIFERRIGGTIYWTYAWPSTVSILRNRGNFASTPLLFLGLCEKGIDAEGNSTPKVDDPIRWFVDRAIGARHTQRTQLDKDVAMVHRSLDEPGFMWTVQERTD
jgi:hypothetical protein